MIRARWPIAATLITAWAAAGARPANAQDGVLPAGAYASIQEVASRARMRPANRFMRVMTTSILLHHVESGADGTRIASRYCAVEQEPLGRTRTMIGPAFVAAIPEWVSRARAVSNADGTWSVEVEEHALVLGAALSDPESEALPSTPDDPRIVDADGDGKPGVSVAVEGMVDGQVYLVQRLIRGLRGTFHADGTMAGTVTGSSDQEVVGASNAALKAFTPRFHQDPDESRSSFRWVPVPESSSCGSVLAARADLFGEG